MKKSPMRRLRRIILFVVIVLLLFAYLIYSGKILPNDLFSQDYEVRGVDVSAYQGEIDWETLASCDIDFAFIKATEGSSFVDRKFAGNWSAAKQTNLRIGAYHFFSFDSSGATQAENFINNVVAFDGMLPPVIDLEFYGDKASNPPSSDDVDRELRDLLEKLTQHYGMRPLIYATRSTYDLYLAGKYDEYDIWYRNIIVKPGRLSDGRMWTFWQYSNCGELEGYHGEERYIDLNVFNGSADDFAAYGR